MLGFKFNHRTRILVIDDSKEYRDVIQQALLAECPEMHVFAPDNFFALNIEATLDVEPYTHVVLKECLAKWEDTPGARQWGTDLIPYILSANSDTQIVFITEQRVTRPDDQQALHAKGIAKIVDKQFFLNKVFAHDAILPTVDLRGAHIKRASD